MGEVKKIFVSYSLLLLGYCTYAQVNLDSLMGIWNDKTKADTTRLDAISYLCQNFWQTHPDSTLVLAESMLDMAKEKGLKRYQADAMWVQAGPYFILGDIKKSTGIVMLSLKLSEEIGYPLGIAQANSGLGMIADGQSDFELALDHYNKALSISEELNTKLKNGDRVMGVSDYKKVTESLGGINTNIAITYFKMNVLYKSIEYFVRSLKYNEEIGKKSDIAGTLNNIASIYMMSGDTTMAIDYFQRSLIIAEEVGSKYVMSANLQNMGNINLGKKDYNKAFDNFSRALKLNEEVGDQYRIAQAMNGLGVTFYEKEDYAKATEYLDKASAIFESMGVKSIFAAILIQKGFVYFKQDEFNKAIQFCKKGLALVEAIKEFDVKRNACNCLYQVYKATKQESKALEFHEKFTSLNDSLNQNETGKKLQRMEFSKEKLADSLVQEETKLKVKMAYEKDINKKKNTRNVFLGLGVMLFIMASGLWNRLRFTRKSKAVLQIEKDRSESLLLNILPTEVAEELKATGTANAKQFDHVTVMFTDFKGFTQISEKLSPTELVAEIHTCFKAFDNIIGRHNIEKIKTIGDSYMCVGGLPVSNTTHAEDIVRAALEIQQFMEQQAKQKAAAGKEIFELRIGINSGQVVAGIVGVKKFAYDIWGDTVNIASRMESSGEAGKVNISESTYELVKDKFTCVHRGKIEAKNKGDIDMYFVESIL